METLTDALDGLAAWWAGLPPLPDLNLPVPTDPALLTVIGTVLLAFGLVGLISGWVERRVSWAGAFATLLAVTLIFWVWEANRESFGPIAIPEAFVELVARIIR